MGKSSRIRNLDQRFNKPIRTPDFKRSCTSKTTYHSKIEAMQAAQYVQSNIQQSMTYYYCDNCGFYHIAHQK